MYISENSKYAPYLILTNDYNSNCLLLRKNLLEEMKSYNEPCFIPSYYENSIIDVFLNSEFINSLDASQRGKIADSSITITNEDSIGIVGQETLTIKRKIFLLSYTEAVGEKTLVNAIEGKYLKYFKDDNPLACASAIGDAGSWWLRTPDTAYYNAVYAISPDGYVGTASAAGDEGVNVNGVRPAFCLPGNTAIYQDTIDGRTVYLICE